MADQARSQGDALPQRPAALSRLGLDHHFPRRVIQYADADVIVGQAGFELFGNFGEHLVRIKSRDGVPRNGVQQGEVPRLGTLFAEQAGVFDGDTRFTCEDAQKFQVPFVKHTLVVGVHGHRADGMIVGHQRYAAEATFYA